MRGIIDLSAMQINDSYKKETDELVARPVQGEEGVSGGGGRVFFGGVVCVLEGAELLLSETLPNNKFLGELEHIKHKLFQFYTCNRNSRLSTIYRF